MSTSSAPSSGVLSPHDRFLIEMTEEAIRDGQQLEQWCRRGPLSLFPIDLKKKFRVPNRAEGFFGTCPINGTPTSVMGALQTNDFGRTRATADQLRDFVYGVFLPAAHWTYPNGWPGGFGIRQSLYQRVDGSYGQFEGDATAGCVDWRTLGREYNWVLLTVNIYDFVMGFGPMRKRFDEAACVAPTPIFIHEDSTAGCVADLSVGYPFVRFAPIPNVFGFGPGKFGTAIKTYNFRLKTGGDLEVRMCFAAAPRCQKVFDFGKSIPDPIYGGARVLRAVSMGAFDEQALHDKLDANMLAQHCRVHQALMDGVEKIWSDWTQNANQPGGVS